jgi:Xaa-Pro aminopeptidase
MGNGEQTRNLPMNKHPFRQDSTFLYFTGCAIPYAAALLEADRFVLFLPEPTEDDPLWHGVVPTLAELGDRFGADEVRPIATLESTTPKQSKTLAVADLSRNRILENITGDRFEFGLHHGDRTLVETVIALRRTKSETEIAEMAKAAAHTRAAHEAVMRATHPGGHEQSLAALFQAVLAARGATLGYPTILTQNGEVLHNFHHDNPLEAGRLLLVDGGGEVSSGFTADVTRTWPVDGRFTGQQRAAYEAVLQAQLDGIALCTAGRPYEAVHWGASLTLAQFLVDEGLVRSSPEAAVESGAHALFFPHGIGHLIGLDVHDLENFGDQAAYPVGGQRPEQFGGCYLRLNLPLEPNWVVTVEPGFYIVPAILDDPRFRQTFRKAIDFDRVERWRGFGGIRIEDDVQVTEADPVVLTGDIPKSIEDIEAIVGSGPTPEVLLA